MPRDRSDGADGAAVDFVQNLGEPGINFYERDQWAAGYELVHDFGPARLVPVVAAEEGGRGVRLPVEVDEQDAQPDLDAALARIEALRAG